MRSGYDSCVYMLKNGEKVALYLLLYVDDILMASSSKDEIMRLKERLNGEFEMKDLGPAKRVLRIDIFRNRDKGNEISQSLFEAIETSLISLVIFSQNYASSSWCLDELVKVVECKEKDGNILLRVFYKVDPTIVRHQNGTYADTFAEHEQKYDSTVVQRWRSALKKPANINGIHTLLNLEEIFQFECL